LLLQQPTVTAFPVLAYLKVVSEEKINPIDVIIVVNTIKLVKLTNGGALLLKVDIYLLLNILILEFINYN